MRKIIIGWEGNFHVKETDRLEATRNVHDNGPELAVNTGAYYFFVKDGVVQETEGEWYTGSDKPPIKRWVYHRDMPQTLETFLKEADRRVKEAEEAVKRARESRQRMLLILAKAGEPSRIDGVKNEEKKE